MAREEPEEDEEPIGPDYTVSGARIDLGDHILAMLGEPGDEEDYVFLFEDIPEPQAWFDKPANKNRMEQARTELVKLIKEWQRKR